MLGGPSWTRIKRYLNIKCRENIHTKYFENITMIQWPRSEYREEKTWFKFFFLVETPKTYIGGIKHIASNYLSNSSFIRHIFLPENTAPTKNITAVL